MNKPHGGTRGKVLGSPLTGNPEFFVQYLVAVLRVALEELKVHPLGIDIKQLKVDQKRYFSSTL